MVTTTHIPADVPFEKKVKGIDPTIDLAAEIKRLGKKRNAIILAHYYQDSEIQDIADFVGDSLDLSRTAAETDADVIAFCGVKFMAETAKILSPDKTVVLPDMRAGCSLEESCPGDEFGKFRAAHADHVAITYVNCSAAVKAHSDIICTSTNAMDIIKQIPKDKPILFAPDKYLGSWLAKKTGRDMLLWQGTCIVHEHFSEVELIKLKAEYEGAPEAAHPECPPAILDHADHIGSTTSILKFATENPSDVIIVATEPHIMHQMQLKAPDKTFIGAPGADGKCSCNDCPFMALNSMEKLYLCLRDLTPEIYVPEDVRIKALRPLKRMLEMSPVKAAAE